MCAEHKAGRDCEVHGPLTIRYADLNNPPVPEREIRVVKDDVVISIWLPASLPAVSDALSALAEAGFEFPKRKSSSEHDRVA